MISLASRDDLDRVVSELVEADRTVPESAPFVALLDHEDPTVRLLAATACADRGDELGLPVLVDLLEETELDRSSRFPVPIWVQATVTLATLTGEVIGPPLDADAYTRGWARVQWHEKLQASGVALSASEGEWTASSPSAAAGSDPDDDCAEGALKPGDLMPEPKHVTWTVDHDAREIRVTVRLALWNAEGAKPTDDVVAYVAAYTEGGWGPTLSFACYTLIITVECRSIDKGEAREDELPVQVDADKPSRVCTYTPQHPDPLGESPKDRVHPREGKFNAKEPFAWSHELGHILGLDDGYIDPTKMDKVPGHASDMMWDFKQKWLSPETVARMVRRSGMVDESKMRCSLSFDITRGTMSVILAEVKDISVHAWMCDWKAPSSSFPATDQRLTFQGTLSFEVGYLHGASNAPARDILQTGLGVDTSPLAPMYGAGIPVTFDIATSGEGTLTIQAGEGLVISGAYEWNQAEGVPVMKGPMSFAGINSASFHPGPPLRGIFTKGAAECAK